MADLFDVKIHPMLATLQPEPFDSEDHIFELKWDGTRALGFISPDGSVKFQNRRLYDITYRYPELHPDVGGRKAILDGRRTRDWLKIKKGETIDAVVCGLTEGEGVREDTFGSLILGVYDGPAMRYIGRVGTGFSDDLRRDLLARCEAIRGDRLFSKEPDMTEPVKFWTRPGLVVEARFLEMTPDGMLRAPSFGRIRDDKRPDECVFPREHDEADDSSQSS